MFNIHIRNQGLIDSKEKRACNLVPIKIQTEANNSTKAAKNGTILLFVLSRHRWTWALHVASS